MNVSTPLPILATLAIDENDNPSISLQRRCKKGNIQSQITTHKFDIRIDGVPAMHISKAKQLLSVLAMRRIHHHGQPEIIDLINNAVETVGLLKLKNQTLCTRTLLNTTQECNYDTDIMDLAHRQAVADSLIATAHNDSEVSCRIFQRLYGEYIRHIKEDVFTKYDDEIGCWEDTLTETEAQIIADSPRKEDLPQNWSLQEAQSLWLMHRAGQPINSLAGMLGVSEIEINTVCDLFRAQPRTAA